MRLILAPFLDVWYYDVEVDEVLEVLDRSSRKDRESVQKVVKKTLYSTQEHTMEKLTESVVGRRRICNGPSLLVRLSEIVREEQKVWITEQHVEKLFKEYIDPFPEEKHQLVSHFWISSGALRIVGICSVGTRCLVLFLEGVTKDDELILQPKEAGLSVLEPYVAKKDYASHAQRIVVGQKLMQTASKIFLAGIKDPSTGFQYYWRHYYYY
jgi:uncharacterized protein (DUF2252 family)